MNISKMKRINQVSNSERRNLNENRESNNRQENARYFEGTSSYLGISNELRNHLQRERSVHFTHNNNNIDCSEEVQYKRNEQSDKVCGYCKKEKHNINDCPSFINAVKHQSSILNNYNVSSSVDTGRLNHSTYYNETDRQHFELDECEIVEGNASKQSETDWTKIATRKSKKSTKNDTLKTEIQNLPETQDSASVCVTETENKFLSKFCHYCKEYGHIEDICPLVQKALGKGRKSSLIVTKIHKKDNYANPITKIKDPRKLKTCQFCGKSDHKEVDCTEHKHQYEYFKKDEQYFRKQMHLKDVCPSLKEDVRKLENQNRKTYLNKQVTTTNSNSKIKYSHMKALKKCDFCGNSDHRESECEYKLRYEYSKYCSECKIYGHQEDTCPLLEEALRKMQNGSYCSSNNITAVTEKLENLMKCNFCEEFGHSANDCFVKQQAEFYSKYCNHCEENGHDESDCDLKKLSFSNNTLSNSSLRQQLEVKTVAQYASICSEHYVCESCHSVYFGDGNSTIPKKTISKAAFETSAPKLRYCTLCGIEGLIDACILKENYCY